MLKRLKEFRDRFSDKTKLVIYISTAAAVFIFCALFPLAFREEVLVDGLFDTGARAEMFSKYMGKENDIRFKVDTKPEHSDERFCSEIFDELYDLCIVDKQKTKVMSEGQEFIELSDKENSMKLCHMWVQNNGDWSNWLDIYVDADTGFVYYMYINSVCIANSADYNDSFSADMDAKSLADKICEETGFRLESFTWSGKPEETATAFTYSSGEALIWKINCTYFPESIVDIKISVA